MDKKIVIHDHTEKYKSIMMPIIQKHLLQGKITLYGSRARKDFHEGSDIDVALDIGCKIEFSIMSKIIEDIENSDLPICFDIVDFYAVSNEMQEDILKEGIVWQK